ncbi:glycosyltransferase family 2 protein [Desulfocurvus sp. DL9XJH121]
MQPLVSIIIPCYNYGRFLPDLFDSLAAQAMGLYDVEVIVVDDGSTDDSADVARELGPGLGACRFKVIPLTHQGHPGPVRNVGLTAARGDLLLCLDPDDSLESEYLERVVGALEAHPEASLAYTDYLESGPEGVRPVFVPEFDPGLLRTQNILCPAAMVRREVFDASRGYSAHTAYEDWEFWVQAAANGFKGLRVPGTLFRYNLHEANRSWKARREDGLAKARIVMDNKYFFGSEVAAWARALLRGEPWAVAFGRGLIPRAEDVRQLLDLSAAVAGRRGLRSAGA